LKKEILLAVLIVCFSATGLAMAVQETRLSDLGIESFSVDGPDTEQCRTFEFIAPQGMTKEDYPILSIHSQFLPVTSRDSTIKVSVNGTEAGVFKSTEFLNGFARLEIPLGLMQEKNSFEVCMKTSFATTKVEFLNDSMIGYYKKPDFSRPDSFVLEVSPANTRLFDEFKVRAVIRNYGSEGVDVRLRYRKESLENETPETELVKGKTTINATLGECVERNDDKECIEPSEASFEFFLRPKLLGRITLLPAIAEFSNQFSENVLIESDRPQVEVAEPEIKIKAFIKSKTDEFVVRQPQEMQLVLINDGTTPLYNISVNIVADGLDIPAEQKTQIVEYLGEKQIIERNLTVKAPASGSFEMGCNVSYLDLQFQKSTCEKRVFEFAEPQISPQIMAGILLVIVSVGAFVYVFYLKK